MGPAESVRLPHASLTVIASCKGSPATKAVGKAAMLDCCASAALGLMVTCDNSNEIVLESLQNAIHLGPLY